MRQLHYTLAVILASLLAASSVAASSCPNFTKELLEDLLSNEARKITIANDETLCDNDQQLTSDAERAATVIIEYSCSGEDCVVTGHDYALVDIRCIDGIWNEESFAPRQSDLYGLVSTGGIIPNSCADCIDMTTLIEIETTPETLREIWITTRQHTVWSFPCAMDLMSLSSGTSVLESAV
ncbi:hypothetical protein GBAR_LOCUS3397 [Geodia barretti]|uniref:Uncharacterized protein n=1 Tax=Geodia barretti TaxID=519541 RepID=A0AA35R403_GEOBA|nr:hypothetical protein GBAR_LOCUS3397 [Geodia barretti]